MKNWWLSFPLLYTFCLAILVPLDSTFRPPGPPQSKSDIIVCFNIHIASLLDMDIDLGKQDGPSLLIEAPPGPHKYVHFFAKKKYSF